MVANGRKTSTRGRPPKTAADGGAPTNRNGANEARWQEILEGAADVFFEKGYAGTSIQDVADRVGLLKGSLYHYISTKEDLLFAILKEVQKAGIGVVETAGAREGDARTRVREFVRDYALLCIRTRIKASVFDRDFHSLTGERRAQLITERDVYDEFLRGLITEGIADGSFSAEVDPVVVGNVIFQMVNSIYHWYSPRGKRSPEEIAGQIADFAIGGLEQAGIDA